MQRCDHTRKLRIQIERAFRSRSWQEPTTHRFFHSGCPGGSYCVYSKLVYVPGWNPYGVSTGERRRCSQLPRWSKDGRWIYFSSNTSGSTQLWKIPREGGVPVQITRGGGFAALESADS